MCAGEEYGLHMDGSTGAAFRILIFELFPYFGNWSPSRHATTTHTRMFPGATMRQRGIHGKLDIVYMALAPGAGKPGGASTRRVGQNDFPQATTLEMIEDQLPPGLLKYCSPERDFKGG
jgi:hypothetical protein